MTIQEALRAIMQNGAELYCKICMVDAIDTDARTVDVTPLDEGAPVLGVNLQSNQDGRIGVVLWPRQGSHVVVAFLNDAAGVVVLTEDVERMELKIGEDNPVEGLIEDGVVKLLIGETTVELAPEKAITFNGGGLGGLIRIQDLTDKLNKLKDEINALVKTFNSHIHTTTATIGPSDTPGVIAKPTSPANDATAFNRQDYENTKITHGQ